MKARDFDPTGLYLRDVDFRIEGDFVSSVHFGDQGGIPDLLGGKGWIIGGIVNESSVWPGSPWTFRISAIVGTDYTDRQVQDQAIRDLAELFRVSSFSILTAPYSGYVYQAGNIATVTVNGGGGANYSPTPGVPTPGTSGGGSDFLSNLGLGAGISTPIALLGGAVVLALILRK